MVKKILFEDPNETPVDFKTALNGWLILKDTKEPLSHSKIQELLTYLVRTKSFESNSQQLQLLDAIFDPIYESIVNSSGLGDYKTISCDTLVVWLSRSIQLLSKTKNDADQLQLFKISLQSHITYDRAQYLFHYVLDFWNDSGAALGNSLKELFVKLISFLSVSNTIETNNKIFKSWLLKSLEIPYSMRVFYFMIEHLYKETEPANFIFQQHPNFIKSSLNFIWSNALASSVGKVVFLLIRHVKPLYENEADWVKLWADDIAYAIQDPKLKRGVESYLLPNLFKVSPTATMIFLKYIIVHYKDDISTMLSCLKLAQETAILIEPFLPSLTNGSPVIEIDTISSLLKSSNSSYRIGAFSLLVSSPKLSKQIPSIVFDGVLKTLDAIFVDNDLETRNEMFSYLQKFVNRIRDSTYALDRDATSLTKKNYEKFKEEIEGKRRAIIESETFFQELLNYIKLSLKPGSSYQRKEMALRCLLMLIRSGLDSRVDKIHLESGKTVSFIYSIPIYDSLLVRLAIDNIADDFEDIRTSSTDVLHKCPLPISEIIDIDTVQSRALILLGDMKGKSVDSGARFFQFLYGYYQTNNQIDQCKTILSLLTDKIQESIDFADNDICTACYTSGIQGYFAAFKFIFEIMNFNLMSDDSNYIFDLVDNLVLLAEKSWNQVKPILQHDSPEGNLPQELAEKYNQELENKYGKGTQVILSYAWRALKESTTMTDVLLKRAIGTSKRKSSTNNSKISIIRDSTILNLGPLLIEQLATIRHRGAFSSTYPTFVSCCTLCVSREELNFLPKKWLDENLGLIQARSNYITRRSAGVPYLITAILTSSKNFLNETFDELYRVASLPLDENIIKESTMNNVNLPQVNAFNCIKVLFIDSQLSDESIFYVDKALNLALGAIASPIWSIRNCAVMLFTALQNRLFSSKKVRNNQLPSYPARLFFNKFKSVRDIFLETLQMVHNNGDNSYDLEKIFPILTIMSRLEPTPDYTGLNDFKNLILGFLSSRVWKVREMAARSYPAIITSRGEFQREFPLLFIRNGNWGVDSEGKPNWNGIHGSLLAQRELLERVEMEAYRDENRDEEISLIYDEEIRGTVIRELSFSLNEDGPWTINLVIFQLLELIKFGSVESDYDHIEGLKLWFEDNYNLKETDKLNGSMQLALRQASEILFNFALNNNQFDHLTNLLELSMFSQTYELQLNAIDFISINIKHLPRDLIRKLVSDCWTVIGISNVWKHVKAKALTLIKDLNIETQSHDDITAVSQHAIQLNKLANDESNEQIQLTTLETLGTYIAQLLIFDLKSHEQMFINWIGKVKLMTDDNQEVHIRSAALKSLVGFNKIYHKFNPYEEAIKQVNEFKCVVLGLVFGYLSDDDDNLATEAANHLWSEVLNSNVNIQNILPVEVEKCMVKHFIELISTNSYLANIVFTIDDESKWFNNVFNFLDQSDLKTLLLPNDLLFGSEKRNLDRDMTMKAHELVSMIENIFIDGQWDSSLDSLKLKIENNLNEIDHLILHNEDTSDGALGSLSSESIFEFVYNTLLIGGCLSRKFGVELDDWELISLIIKGDDQWHELVYNLVK